MTAFGDSPAGETLYYTSDGGDIVVEYEGELEPEEGEGVPREIDLGDGFRLVMSPDWFKKMMHSAEITAMVEQRCSELADMANSMAIVEGAEYIYFVSNNTDNIRARGRVKTGNAEAIKDNLTHSTLLHALASVGSDPVPTATENDGLEEGEPDMVSESEPGGSEVIGAVEEALE